MPEYTRYRVTIKWTQDGKSNKWDEHLPEGRMSNATSVIKMTKDDPGEAATIQWALDEYWPNMLKAREETDRPKIENPRDVTVTVTKLADAEWCLTWFSHWTFDDGRTDQEYIASFWDYVDSVQRRNAGLPEAEQECLMGAEDRWRWRGADNSEPPCRCDGCKANGIVRIDH